MFKRKLHLDFETRSVADLRKVGAYVYSQHPSTEVLLACWALDDEPIQTWYRGTAVPEALTAALADPTVEVCAHNAGYERLMIANVLPATHWPSPDLRRWDCTAARAARQALPRSLQGAGEALGLTLQKDKEGHALMMRMCKPRDFDDDGSPIWWEDEARMKRLAEYCARDVEVERELDHLLKPLSPFLKDLWCLTEVINDRGVEVDTRFAADAITHSTQARTALDAEISRLTNDAVKTASNVPALRAWLTDLGVILPDTDDESLAKKKIQEHLTKRSLPKDVRRVLEIRLEAGKTSVAKYQAMINRANADRRVRGNFVFHGAATGRYAGSGIQPQNLPRKTVKDWGEAAANLYALSLDDLSRMIRGTIVAPEGKTLVWADFAAIEARGIAWLAGADGLVQQFADGAKVYENMAAIVYSLDPASIGSESMERQLGKQVILGAGYGMGAAKFQVTCEGYGMPVDAALAERAISAYRHAYAEVPAFWYALENAAKSSIQRPGRPFNVGKVSYQVAEGWLMCRLPSGRVLHYANPRIAEVESKWGTKEVLQYDAVHPMTKKWGPEITWGGKLAENVTQATCADLIMGAMLRLEEANYPVVLTVHDEVVCEVPDALVEKALTDVPEIMCEAPKWADGFPIKAEVKSGKRYGK